MDKTTATAKISTLELTPGKRALGRFIPLTIDEGLPETAKDLASDSFWEYFENSPVSLEECPQERTLNRNLLDWAKESPSWEKNRQVCVANSITSAISAELLNKVLMSDEAIKEMMEKEKEKEKALEEAEKQKNLSDAAQNAADQATDQQQKSALEKTASESLAKAEAAQKKADRIGKGIQKSLDKMKGSKMGDALRASAIKQAGEKSEEIGSMMSGWGMEPGEVQPSDIQSIRTMMENLVSNESIRNITELMGRLKSISSAVMASKPSSKKSDTIVSDGYTQQIENIFPSELALLRHDAPPILRAEKIAEYAQHGLIGMIPGDNEEHKGRLVIAVDESGSMSGLRNEWAKALALAIAKSSNETGQPYSIFGFSTGYWGKNSDTKKPITSDDDWISHIKWASATLGGGTNFNLALNDAMNLVEGSNEQNNTDIVFISDGEAGINPETMKRYNQMKADYSVRLIYLAVGECPSEGDLEKMAISIYLPDGGDIEEATRKLTEALR